MSGSSEIEDCYPQIEAPTLGQSCWWGGGPFASGREHMARSALLIDDDESVRFVLRNALMESGWSITELDDGCEAAGALASRAYDLVVLDLHMPGMNGFEVLRQLRRYDLTSTPVWKTRSDVPVMVISGQAEEASLSFAARIGANACLTKPFNVADVQRIAHELEEKRRAAPHAVSAETPRRVASKRRKAR